MKKQIYICWKNGPKTVKEEFDMLGSVFMKGSVTEHQIAYMEKVSKRKFVDFIPEEFFVSSCASYEGTAIEKLDKIYEFVSKTTYPISIDFLDTCKNLKELKLFVFVQSMLIEILVNNHNIGIMLSKETTDYFYSIVADCINVDNQKAKSLVSYAFNKIVSGDCHPSLKCISDFEVVGDICYVNISTNQSLCRHSI